MREDEIQIGFTACYIHDYPQFGYVCEIPEAVAVEWAQQPWIQEQMDVNMGNGTLAQNMTIGLSTDTDAKWNGWLNKLFVVVGESHGRYLAVYKHDDTYSLYQEKR